MNITHKHLRLFVEEEGQGWLASVCDLDQFQFVHEGRTVHPTVEAAQNEAVAKADELLKETTNLEWSNNPTLKTL